MSKKPNKIATKKGFTLIELLITISIGAVIVALVVPNLLGARSQANAGMAKTLQNQLNTTYSQWTALGGKHSATAASAQVLTTDLLNTLKSTSGTFDSTGVIASADAAIDGPSTADAVNSSAIRTQLNDGDLGIEGGLTTYSNFTIVFTPAGTNTGSFAVAVAN